MTVSTFGAVTAYSGYLLASSILTKETWCLFESNEEVVKPLQAIRGSRARIIQAASPQSNRFEWVGKDNLDTLSDQDINDFYVLFGPSACNVFTYAACPDDYKKILSTKFKDLKLRDFTWLVEDIGEFYRKVGESDKVNAEASHWILGVFPSPYRRDVRVDIYTPEVFRFVQNAFASEWDQHAGEMFELFRSDARTRGPAGYILEDRLHQTLASGG
ncbi:hypothetical protein WG66_011874 [Moniliophthora roreri]|nr:hypothetical protein WG66_011874 [Moniliophthora roreri]